MIKAPRALKVGTRIENYEIVRVLGAGGFGITYKAIDHTLQRNVALKEYLPEKIAGRAKDGIKVALRSRGFYDIYKTGLERFLNEARTIAKFNSPNIVSVNGYVETNNTAYIVMDYESGKPLSRILSRRDRLDPSEIRMILLPVLQGLRVLHRQGVLHRDIKPGNIYIRRSGPPLLLDFGAARHTMRQQAQPVVHTVTPGYAPIEQYNNQLRQGPWTDLYGLGATMYYCMTSRTPAPAPDRAVMIKAGRADPMISVSTLVGEFYPPELLSAVDWLLKLLPTDRPKTAEQVLSWLEPGKPKKPVVEETLLTRKETTRKPRAQWDPVTLQKTEEKLAQYVGKEAAPILVRRAAEKTTELKRFFELLAQSIPKRRDRSRFMSTFKNK